MSKRTTNNKVELKKKSNPNQETSQINTKKQLQRDNWKEKKKEATNSLPFQLKRKTTQIRKLQQKKYKKSKQTTSRISTKNPNKAR